MLQDILSAIPLGVVIAFLIGPVFFALLETSAIKGFRAALAFDMGVFVADIIFLLVAYFMTSSILSKLKDDPSLFIFGGGILAAYGVISFAKTRKSYLKEVDPNVLIVRNNNYFKLFGKGFLLNFINVGVLGFWLGLIVVFSPQFEGDGNRLFIFFSATLATYFFVDLFKILAAKSLNRYLTPFRIFWLKRLIAIIMMICGAVLIFKGVFPDTSKRLEDNLHIMPEIIDSEDLKEIEDELLKELDGEESVPENTTRDNSPAKKETQPTFDPSRQGNKPEIDIYEDDDIFKPGDSIK